MSVILSKNNCQTFPKIGSGNKRVTLSYKSWNFGPICARYGWNGFGVRRYQDLRDSYLIAILDKIEFLTIGFWCQAIHKKFLQRFDTSYKMKLMVKIYAIEIIFTIIFVSKLMSNLSKTFVYFVAPETSSAVVCRKTIWKYIVTISKIVIWAWRAKQWHPNSKEFSFQK